MCVMRGGGRHVYDAAWLLFHLVLLSLLGIHDYYVSRTGPKNRDRVGEDR